MKKQIALTIAPFLIAGVFYSRPTPLKESTPIKPSLDLKYIEDSLKAPIVFPPFLHTDAVIKMAICDTTVNGTINAVQTDSEGVTRIGGEIPGGSFCFAINEYRVTGVIMYPSNGTYFEFEANRNNIFSGSWTKKLLKDFACFELPTIEEGEGANAVGNTASKKATVQSDVPILNSNPNASMTLFLDFIGGKIQEPMWNKGKVIDATPANFSADEIKTAFNIVVERYSPFKVNITTDPKRYKSASVGSRMRVVFTTNSFIRGYGGYAYINTIQLAGNTFYGPAIPCFVFVNALSNNAKYAGECAAHELGHTFGLKHDGIVGSSSYYTGQSDWAPIMGAAYYKPVVQWSKGEYSKANNTEDDISIIAKAKGVGYMTEDNFKSPIALPANKNFEVKDIVSRSDSFTTGRASRYFVITADKTKTLELNAKVTEYSGLNTQLEVFNTRDTLKPIARNTINKSLNSSLSMTVNPGTYLIKVSGVNEGTFSAAGFSAYGSVGSYVLSGTLK
jgi:hypothetical protein